MLLYVAVGGAGALYFQLGGDGGAKRRLFPAFMTLCGALFVVVVFGSWGGGAGPRPWFIIPFVALITFANIRLTTFCPQCGRMIQRSLTSSRATACPR